jgi:hypothetical protein
LMAKYRGAFPDGQTIHVFELDPGIPGMMLHGFR